MHTRGLKLSGWYAKRGKAVADVPGTAVELAKQWVHMTNPSLAKGHESNHILQYRRHPAECLVAECSDTILSGIAEGWHVKVLLCVIARRLQSRGTS